MNPVTGAGYVVWLQPADGQIRLYRVTGWNIDSPGLTQIGSAGGVVFDTVDFHDLVLSFSGDAIEVYYDDQLLISAVDTTYGSGAVALDVSNQPIEFDDVQVTFGPYTGPAPAQLVDVTVAPADVTLSAVGATVQLQVTGEYDDTAPGI